MSFSKHTPIQYLPNIGWRTAKVMHELGIHTAGQLQHMPESVLVELFGPSIRNVLQLLQEEKKEIPNIPSTKNTQSKNMKEWASAIGNEKLSWFSRFKLAAQFVSHLE